MVSFLDELREDAAQARAQAVKTLGIPGTRFGVRFVPPPRTKLASFMAAYRANAVDSDDEVQFLIDCHQEVVRRHETRPPDQWDPVDPDGGPLRFDGSDERWDLGERGTARGCVAALYHLEERPIAASGHVQTLVSWLQGMEAELERMVEDAGKANGAAP
jgi:hypothetical protein